METKKHLWLKMLLLEWSKESTAAAPQSPERDAWVEQCESELKELRANVSLEERQKFMADWRREREAPQNK
jgi:hypothetical protein